MKKDFNYLELELKELLFDHLIIGKEHKLSSGKSSSVYVNVKTLVLRPQGNRLVSQVLVNRVPKDTDFIGGIELGGAIIASCIQSYLIYKEGVFIPSFIVRKQRKDHGTRNLIESPTSVRGKIVLVEDVITTGSSVLKGIELLEPVAKILCVVDREEYSPKFKKFSHLIDSVFTLQDLTSCR